MLCGMRKHKACRLDGALSIPHGNEYAYSFCIKTGWYCLNKSSIFQFHCSNYVTITFTNCGISFMGKTHIHLLWWMDTNMLTYIPDIWDTAQQHDGWENGECMTWDIIAQPNAIMLGLHIVTSPCQHVPIPRLYTWDVYSSTSHWYRMFCSCNGFQYVGYVAMCI